MSVQLLNFFFLRESWGEEIKKASYEAFFILI